MTKPTEPGAEFRQQRDAIARDHAAHAPVCRECETLLAERDGMTAALAANRQVRHLMEADIQRPRATMQQIIKHAPTTEPSRDFEYDNHGDTADHAYNRALWASAQIARAALRPGESG